MSSSPIKLRGSTTASSSSSPSRVCSRWSDLGSDLLVSIFCILSSVDLITGVSAVCSSWRVAVRNPQCWRIIDLSRWDFDNPRPGPVSVDQIFHRVFKFSGGAACIEEVYLPIKADWGDLLFIADRIPNLLYLGCPSLLVSDEQDSSALANFKSLKGLEVNPHLLTSHKSHKTFSLLSTHLTNLSELKLTISSRHNDKYSRITPIICAHFPKLRKLEMPSIDLNSNAILMLLDSLEHLEYLDVSGYDWSGLTKEIHKKATRLKVFIWHSTRNFGEYEEDSNCEEAELEYQVVVHDNFPDRLTYSYIFTL